jgi:hypothetical protein
MRPPSSFFVFVPGFVTFLLRIFILWFNFQAKQIALNVVDFQCTMVPRRSFRDLIFGKRYHPKQILKGATFSCEPGTLTAILGPSGALFPLLRLFSPLFLLCFCGLISFCVLIRTLGAGKTTLLDMLALRKNTGKLQGRITVNGKSIEDRNSVLQYKLEVFLSLFLSSFLLPS